MPGRDAPFSVQPADSCPFVLDTATSARTRHPFVAEHVVPGDDGFRVSVALPLRQRRAQRRRYPVLVLADTSDQFGSAVEMARVLAATKEVRECIVVGHEDAHLAPGDAEREARCLERIAAWCRETLRVESGEVALFGSGRSLACVEHLFRAGSKAFDRWIVNLDEGADPGQWARSRRSLLACTMRVTPSAGWPEGVAGQVLPEATAQGTVVPALVHGLRTFWSTGHAYGSELMPLSKPLVSGAITAARPLIRWLRGGSVMATKLVDRGPNRHVLRSTIMNRDFEIFVSLPEAGRLRAAHPAVVALDANSTWSVVSETAGRMARAGEIEDLITIGVGVPRAEGDIAFGLRRFEELSPPGDETVFDDPLGRFFAAVFALFGADVRDHFGLAPLFHRFLCEELLPLLLATLPIDPAHVGLLGHSAAGTFVGYAAAQAPSPFSRFALLSPGVSIGRGWMLERGGGLRVREAGRPVLISLGSEERTNAFNGLAGIPLAERYARELRAAGGGPVEFHELAGETHTSVFPRVLALALARQFDARRGGG